MASRTTAYRCSVLVTIPEAEGNCLVNTIALEFERADGIDATNLKRGWKGHSSTIQQLYQTTDSNNLLLDVFIHDSDS